MKNIAQNLKSLFSKMDKTLFTVTVLFFLFGLLFIVSASGREAVARYDLSTYYYFYKQTQMLIIGSILSYILLNLRTSTYKNLVPFAYAGVLLLVLALFPLGVEVNGAKNWLPIPGVGTIQPSELSKPVMIVFVSILFDRYSRLFKSNDGKKYEKIGIILIIAGLIPVLTFFQKDLGSALIMIGVFGILFLSSNIKRIDKFKTICLVVGVGIVGLALVYLKQGYVLSPAQMARFDFFNPCSKYETSGFQVCNSFIAINDGGLFGLGIGKSKQKYSYIPEPHTDSIFAVIAEEGGAIATVFIFAGYLFVLFRIIKISMNATNLRNKYISLGIGSYIFMHLFINLGGLFGIIPLTGVPLPFLSYGGTYAISLMCSLAVVQRIHIETKIEKSKRVH